ncbi:hypothetical protein E2562_017557 [Oryza meyeriana var. granulata]|uniref:Uncharacterized protein n=1 Tax=Oryza meyeriana var. granulata TaxID=110450 RepID=A0A6G1C8I8_9ORYZ|nr:hypothetical protein E2562_017557 [Oryza meyeriana var. granulata]
MGAAVDAPGTSTATVVVVPRSGRGLARSTPLPPPWLSSPPTLETCGGSTGEGERSPAGAVLAAARFPVACLGGGKVGEGSGRVAALCILSLP